VDFVIFYVQFQPDPSGLPTIYQGTFYDIQLKIVVHKCLWSLCLKCCDRYPHFIAWKCCALQGTLMRSLAF